jgi:hypothetical protein
VSSRARPPEKLSRPATRSRRPKGLVRPRPLSRDGCRPGGHRGLTAIPEPGAAPPQGRRIRLPDAAALRRARHPGASGRIRARGRTGPGARRPWPQRSGRSGPDRGCRMVAALRARGGSGIGDNGELSSICRSRAGRVRMPSLPGPLSAASRPGVLKGGRPDAGNRVFSRELLAFLPGTNNAAG